MSSFADKVEEIRQGVKKLQDLGTVDILSFPKDPTYSVPSETQTVEKRGADISLVTRVIIHWPPGVNSLVDVRVMFGKTLLVPAHRDEWVTKDDATIAYIINKAVDQKADLRVIWRNRDTANDHKVPVDVEYIRRG